MEKIDMSMHSGAQDEALDLKNRIIKAEDLLGKGRITYYVDDMGNDENDGLSPELPIRSLVRVRTLPLRSGDRVLFKRNAVFRTQEPIFLRGGVTYGAYGKGEKPVVYGSLYNYADAVFWMNSAVKNVWLLTQKLDEVGNITFQENSENGVRKFAREQLEENGDFYYDPDAKTLELYFDKGNPADYFGDIEIASARELMYGVNVNDVNIDNICFKYASCFALSFGNNKGIHVSNCEVGWIGGAVHTSGVRYGNGIQFWHRGEDISVENCWLYQIFDAALTFQGKGMDKSFFKGVRFEHNLIEFSSMNFEFWVGEKGKNASIQDILFAHNIVRMGGYGWGGTQREPYNNGGQALILGWNYHYDEMENFVCRDNILDCADCNLIYTETPEQQPGLSVIHNSYYQKRTTGMSPYVEIIRKSGLYADNQEEFEKAISHFDSEPALVQWIE